METMTDQQREDAIDEAAMRLQMATSQDARREAWTVLSQLIAGRSSRKVAAMEVAKGLSPHPFIK